MLTFKNTVSWLCVDIETSKDAVVEGSETFMVDLISSLSLPVLNLRPARATVTISKSLQYMQNALLGLRGALQQDDQQKS